MGIPRDVILEIMEGGTQDDASRWIELEAEAFAVDTTYDDSTIRGWDLGKGETAVLSWAHQHPGFEAIVDDRAARNCGLALGISVRGTLGVLLLAKREGLIQEVMPLVNSLIEAGFWIGDDVRHAILKLAGETES